MVIAYDFQYFQQEDGYSDELDQEQQLKLQFCTRFYKQWFVLYNVQTLFAFGHSLGIMVEMCCVTKCYKSEKRIYRLCETMDQKLCSQKSMNALFFTFHLIICYKIYKYEESKDSFCVKNSSIYSNVVDMTHSLCLINILYIFWTFCLFCREEHHFQMP